VPPDPVEGVPLNTPVEASNEMPFGSVPVSASVGIGDPFAVTIKYEFIPTVNVALSALVMVGAMFWFLCPSPYDDCWDPPLSAVDVLVPFGKVGF